MALPEFERNLRSDRLRKPVGLDVGRLELSVDVDLDPGGAARAVVGDEEVSPDAGSHMIGERSP